MRKISNYNNFRNESFLEVLLEANISYKKDFIDVLNSIDSPVKDNLLSFLGKEIDVNQNYIDILVNKDDTVSFYQDDKLSKITTDINYSSILINTTNELSSEFPDSGITKVDSNIDSVLRSKSIIPVYVERDILEGDSLYNSLRNYITSGYTLHLVRVDAESIPGLDKTLYLIAYGIERNVGKLKSSEIKVGRFVRAILKKADVEFKDKDIEDFVNKYKAAIKVKKDAFDRFELVSGDAIRHWYHENNYKSINGTLGGSCMRYSRCQGFLTIYVRNTKQVSLLILKPENENDKIIGRALIWTDDSGRKIMDRIYTIDSSDITLFIQYARANNYYYKKKQNYEPMPLVLDGVTLTNAESSSIITLEYSSMNYYPYMDTFKYFNEEDGTITNDYSNDYTYELTDTNGGNGSCDVCGGGGRRVCSDCDGDGDVSCWECSGEGDVNCSDCDGDGEYECPECDGEGDIECDECDGEGCDDCDNGRKECQNCNNGQIKCDECNSKGVVDCDECGGSGRRECGECYGEGEYDCYECT